MRAIVQRVANASVQVDSVIVAAIGKGLLILLGIEENDLDEDAVWLAGKISGLRIFNDENGVMNCSIVEKHGELLAVSQFTLYASIKKGNRPSYIRAARPEFALPMYEKFIDQLHTQSGLEVRTGIFGADMKVSLVNDGPVTLIIDTKNRE